MREAGALAALICAGFLVAALGCGDGAREGNDTVAESNDGTSLTAEQVNAYLELSQRVRSEMNDGGQLSIDAWRFILLSLRDDRVNMQYYAVSPLLLAVDEGLIPRDAALALVEVQAITAESGADLWVDLYGRLLGPRESRTRGEDMAELLQRLPSMKSLDARGRQTVDRALHESDPSTRRGAAFVLLWAAERSDGDREYATGAITEQLAQAEGDDARFWQLARDVVLRTDPYAALLSSSGG